MTSEPRDDSLAVAALTLGVASLPLLLCSVVSIPAGLAGLILGYLARRRVARGSSSARYATIGMLCGSLGLIAAAVIIILPN